MGILSAFRFTFQNLFFSPILYGVIASLSIFSAVYDNGDRLKDQLTDRYRSQDDTFDFVIVGGGSAGAVLAYRLSEFHTVLLLEAGGESHPFQAIPGLSIFLSKLPGTDWRHKSVTQSKSCLACRNKKYTLSQGKNLGGSGNLNYLVHLRGNPLDYDNWATITGDPSWSYEGVLPYFIQSEHYIGGTTDKTAHGYGGPLQVQVPDCIGLAAEWNLAGIEMGYPHIDLNGKHSEGFDTIFYPIKNGIRQATYRSYIQPVRNRPSLLIRKFAHVNKVLIRQGTNDAYGVEYDRHGHRKHAFANKEVILSAGTLQTPKLLILSGVGQLDHLTALRIPVKSVLPVGKNLQDHVSTLLGPFYINKPKTISFDRDIDKQSFIQLTNGKGPLTTTGYQAAAVVSSSFAKSHGQALWPDIQLSLFGVTPHRMFYSDIAHAFGLREDILRKYYGDVSGHENAFFIQVTVARPLSKGDICLPTKNPYKPSAINPNYLSDEGNHDVKVMIEGIRRALYLAENTTIFHSLDTVYSQKCFPGCENIPFRSDVYWECYLRAFTVANGDHVGTCAMGKKGSPYAVVDPHLQVQGTQRLRVVDASIMPTIVGTPTQAATIMIAEKGARLILEKWKHEAKLNYGPPGKNPGVPIDQYGPPGKIPGPLVQYGPPGKNPGPPVQYGPPGKIPDLSTQYGPPRINFTPPVQYGPPPPLNRPGNQYGPPRLSPPPQSGGDGFSNYDSFSVIKDQLAPSFGSGPGATELIPLQRDMQMWSSPAPFPNSDMATGLSRDDIPLSYSTPPSVYPQDLSQLLVPPQQSGSPSPPPESSVDLFMSTASYPVNYNLDMSRSEKTFIASDIEGERVYSSDATSSDLRKGKSLQETPSDLDGNQLDNGFDADSTASLSSSTTGPTPFQTVTEVTKIDPYVGHKRVRTTPRVVIHPRGHLGHQYVKRNRMIGIKLNETLADLFLTTSSIRPVPKDVVKIKRRRPVTFRRTTAAPVTSTAPGGTIESVNGNDLTESFVTYTTPPPNVPEELKQPLPPVDNKSGKKRFVRRMYARPVNFNKNKRSYGSNEPVPQPSTLASIIVQAPASVHLRNDSQTENDGLNATEINLTRNLLTEESKNLKVVMGINHVLDIASKSANKEQKAMTVSINATESLDDKDNQELDAANIYNGPESKLADNDKIENLTLTASGSFEDSDNQTDLDNISNIEVPDVGEMLSSLRNYSSLEQTYEDYYDDNETLETSTSSPPTTTTFKPILNSRLAFKLRNKFVRDHS